jgi:hypothetical protein
MRESFRYHRSRPWHSGILLLNSTSNSSARTGVSLLGSGLTFSNAEEKVMNLLLTKTKEAGKAYATPEDRWNAVVNAIAMPMENSTTP